MNTPLDAFSNAVTSGAIRIVDLTHTLTPDFPALVLPPELGQVGPFRIETISNYDEAGPRWYWNNFSCGEHTGTHFDAPAHWITGKEHPSSTVDTIDARNFLAPAAVVENPGWQT